MKREILFRGKRIDNGEWVEGDLLNKCSGSPKISIHGEYNRGLFVVDSYEVIPETVGQWTGLTDKNGKKIFEGDKVWCMAGEHRSGVWEYEKQFVVKYGWSQSMWEMSMCDEIEVIGNIHEEAQ